MAAFEDGRERQTPSFCLNLSQLNAVRIIIVMFIAIGYASTMKIGPGAPEWFNLFGYDPSLYGIQVLFFLSGWLAWRSLDQGRSLRHFVKSRAKHVMPWLFAYTIIVVVLLYPLLCNHDAPNVEGMAGLTVYFFKTVTLIQPGTTMHGALDHAAYPCMLQGTVWTLRWGAIAYIGLILMHRLGFRHIGWSIALFLIALTAHCSLNLWSLSGDSQFVSSLIPLIRLMIPTLLGVILYQCRAALPRKARTWFMIAAGWIGLATLHYSFLRWTPMIELLAMAGWCSLSVAVLRTDWTMLKHWPKIAVAIYLGIWPITQLWLAVVPAIAVPNLVIAAMASCVALALMINSLQSVLATRLHRRVQTA
jgi:hypothetical protein